MNLARNGRRSRSFIGEGLWAAALKARADPAGAEGGGTRLAGKAVPGLAPYLRTP